MPEFCLSEMNPSHLTGVAERLPFWTIIVAPLMGLTSMGTLPGNGGVTGMCGRADRFRDNEVAAKMGIKFYCGSPVVGSSGHRLGTLCFTDGKPRKFKAEELVILANLCAPPQLG